MNRHDVLLFKKDDNVAPPASSHADEVSEPLPWPTLSPLALHGLAGEIVRSVADTSEADPAAILATVLGLFGTAVGRSAGVQVGNDTHHARLFSVIVGSTARARKGTSENGPRRIFEAAEKILTSRSFAKFPCNQPLAWVPGPLSSGEGLVYAIRDGQRKVEDGDPGVPDKRLFVVEGEFAAPLRTMQRQGNTLSTTLRSAWDGRSIAPLTKAAPIKATDPHIGIIGHITLQELRASLTNVEVYNGFANRILWWCAKRSRLLPLAPGMSEDVINSLATRFATQIERASEISKIEFDSDARALYERLYARLTEDVDGSLWATVTARAEAQVIRLAVTFALLDASPIITTSHLEAAVAVWQYCNDSAQYLFGSSAADPTTERIIDCLRTGPKSTRDLHKAFSGHMAANKLNEALEALQSRGRIERTEVATAGRPASTWTLVGSEQSELSEQNRSRIASTNLGSQNSLLSQPQPSTLLENFALMRTELACGRTAPIAKPANAIEEPAVLETNGGTSPGPAGTNVLTIAGSRP